MRTRRPPLLPFLFVSLAFILLSGPTAQAQSVGDALFFSERPPATGPRLLGMAGTSIAGVGDVGALYSNPAGLGMTSASQLTGSFRGLYVTNDATYETFGGALDDPRSFGLGAAEASRTDYGLGNLGVLYKAPTAQGAFVVGLAVNETRLFGRDLEFQNRNQFSSVTDFFLPVSGEVDVASFAPGETPELLTDQFLVEGDEADFVVDFDPDGDGVVNRPLSLAAFQTFAIDFVPGLFEGDNPAQSFLPAVAGGTQFRQAGDFTEDGALREFNFGGSIEAARGVFVGASGNVSFGRYELRQVFEEIDDRNENDGTGGTVNFDRLRFTRNLESDFTGFSVRVGLSAELTSALRAGLTIETPTWYSVNEETSFRLLTAFDDGFSDVYGDDAGERAERRPFEYDIRTPWRFGAGLSAEIGGLRLSGDATLVDWTQLQLEAADGADTFTEENAIIEDDFDPVVQTRVGAELTLSPLILRGGFAYHPAPASFSALNADFLSTSLDVFGEDVVDERSRTYLSAGLGYQVDDYLRIDLAWMQERFEDRTLPYASQNASFVNEDVERNQFLVGLTFFF